VRQRAKQRMNQKTRRKLIMGIALTIFGPVIGWILSIAGLFHSAASMQNSLRRTPPGVLPDMSQMLGQTTSEILISMLPLLIGAACGALGVFLVLYALVIHFFPAKNGANT
jgi:hypothetical protein